MDKKGPSKGTDPPRVLLLVRAYMPENWYFIFKFFISDIEYN
eukprot:SAG31_NODE_2045_length_6576_cov_3.774587_7_plen_42_part_00